MHGTIKNGESLLKVQPVTAATLEKSNRTTLLAGLVIDARGGPMVPSAPPGSGGASARYYVSSKTHAGSGLQERIPSNRLDSSIVAMLRRIRLLGDSHERSDLVAVLRRVVVLEDAVILQLDKRQCLATWRVQDPILQRITTSDVLRLIGTCLAKNEEISEAGTALCLSMPRHSRARKIRTRNLQNALLFQKTI
jgi:hypothetical protein